MLMSMARWRFSACQFYARWLVVWMFEVASITFGTQSMTVNSAFDGAEHAVKETHRRTSTAHSTAGHIVLDLDVLGVSPFVQAHESLLQNAESKSDDGGHSEACSARQKQLEKQVRRLQGKLKAERLARRLLETRLQQLLHSQGIEASSVTPVTEVKARDMLMPKSELETLGDQTTTGVNWKFFLPKELTSCFSRLKNTDAHYKPSYISKNVMKEANNMSQIIDILHRSYLDPATEGLKDFITDVFATDSTYDSETMEKLSRAMRLGQTSDALSVFESMSRQHSMKPLACLYNHVLKPSQAQVESQTDRLKDTMLASVRTLFGKGSLMVSQWISKRGIIFINTSLSLEGKKADQARARSTGITMDILLERAKDGLSRMCNKAMKSATAATGNALKKMVFAEFANTAVRVVKDFYVKVWLSMKSNLIIPSLEKMIDMVKASLAIAHAGVAAQCSVIPMVGATFCAGLLSSLFPAELLTMNTLKKELLLNITRPFNSMVTSVLQRVENRSKGIVREVKTLLWPAKRSSLTELTRSYIHRSAVREKAGNRTLRHNVTAVGSAGTSGIPEEAREGGSRADVTGGSAGLDELMSQEDVADGEIEGEGDFNEFNSEGLEAGVEIDEESHVLPGDETVIEEGDEGDNDASARVANVGPEIVDGMFGEGEGEGATDAAVKQQGKAVDAQGKWKRVPSFNYATQIAKQLLKPFFSIIKAELKTCVRSVNTIKKGKPCKEKVQQRPP